MIVLVSAVLFVQQTSFYARTFPNPSGDNGWEEYAMAADIVNARGVDRILNYYYYDNQGQNLKDDRHALHLLGRAGDLIRQGNRKPLRGLNDLTEDREFRGALNSVCKLLAIESRVRISDGNASAFARSIIDAMTFADRISDDSLIDVLSSHAKHQIALGSLQFALYRLDLSSARELTRFFDERVASVSPFVAAMRSNILESVRDPRRHLDEIAEESPYWSPPTELAEATPAQREQFVTKLGEEFKQLEPQIDPLFKREERFWKFNPSSGHRIVDYALSISSLRQVPGIAARYRTQFRLAALHCRIIEFKQTYNRWPEKLEELGGREVWYDPAGGGPFYYAKLTDQSYTLYSLGTPETGRIDLVWRGPPKD